MDNPPPGWTVPHSTGFGFSRIGKSLEQIKQSAWGKLDQQQRASAYSAAQSKRILDKFKEKYVEELKQTLPDYVIVKFPIGPVVANPWDQDEVVNKAVPEVPDEWDGDVTKLPEKLPAPPSSEAQAGAAAALIGNDDNAKSRLIKSLLYNFAIQEYRNVRNGAAGDLDSAAGGKRNLRDNSNPFTYTIDGNKRFNKLLELFYGGIQTQPCKIHESAVYRYCQKTIPDDTLLTSFITEYIITNFAPPEDICINLAKAAAAQARAEAPGGGGGAVGGGRNATRRKAKRNQKARRRTR